MCISTQHNLMMFSFHSFTRDRTRYFFDSTRFNFTRFTLYYVNYLPNHRSLTNFSFTLCGKYMMMNLDKKLIEQSVSCRERRLFPSIIKTI